MGLNLSFSGLKSVEEGTCWLGPTVRTSVLCDVLYAVYRCSLSGAGSCVACGCVLWCASRWRCKSSSGRGMPLTSFSKTEALTNYNSYVICSWCSLKCFLNWHLFAALSKSGIVFLLLLCKTNCLLPIALQSMFVQLPPHKWSTEGLYVTSRVNQCCCCLWYIFALSWWFLGWWGREMYNCGL